MSFALFDEAGKFLAGRILSQSDNSMQVELDSGKRVKVKAANVMLQFTQPAPAEMLMQAHAQAQTMDLDLAWEFAPLEEFDFVELAQEYFSANADPVMQAAALMRLTEAPHYFRRMGKGRFKKAPEETVKAALLAIERKQQQQLQIDAWAQELVDGHCPETIREQLFKLLFKPDKNAAEYKAVVEAAKRSQTPPLQLFTRAGAITSAYEFHWRRFLFEHFPNLLKGGDGFAALPSAPLDSGDALPLADVRAFSIDDSSTTEIDDALSVQGIGTGVVTVGIHIAAPGLAIHPQGPVDVEARARMSTVYMPGHKITMLPDAWVQRYTLQEGRACPAVSLYVKFDENSWARLGHETRLERVPIEANLRHDQLDQQVSVEALSTGALGTTDLPFAAELSCLFRLALQLKAEREQVRGKPETFNRPDYTFKLHPSAATPEGAADHAPTGDERVEITVRKRGEPLDLIVAEAMILANSTWGGWLHELGVPALYRSQASLAPGVKVRMSTKAAPHAGIGVAQYAWSTSPLRRYTDLVNQWQIIACARHGATAALAAPFKPKDADLFAILSGFDEAYSAYNVFQNGMERFWTLRYLQQNAVQELNASVIKDDVVRADDLPLVCAALGAQGLPRGARVKVRIQGLDLLTLDVSATVSERLGADAQDGTAPVTANAEDEADEALGSGPLSLAMDVDAA